MIKTVSAAMYARKHAVLSLNVLVEKTFTYYICFIMDEGGMFLIANFSCRYWVA